MYAESRNYRFEEGDFRTLDQFPLKWRWTEEKYTVLPPDDLAQIRPLAEEKAAGLWQHCADWISRNSWEEGLSPEHFTDVQRINAEGEGEPARKRLRELSPAEEEQIIVRWDNRTAVVTKWGVFCRWWSDFCYPAGDDVVIWPLSEAWGMVYWHEEQFIFGLRCAGVEESDAHRS
jgi:hypothetical protein